MNLEDITVVTTAFGNPASIIQWASRWLELNVRCIVCDNGDVLPEALPSSVRVLPFTGNTGFGAGINRAVSCADTPLILVTNPDTLPFSPDSLSSLVKSHSPGSISSGVLLDADGREVPSGGIWPNILWLRQQIFGRTESLWRDDRIDWIQGALILCLKEDFTKLQGFSPRFPLYFEDVDFCARASSLGMVIKHEKESRFFHFEGTGSSGTEDVRLSGYHWGLYEYFRTHLPDGLPEVRRLILAKCLLRVFLFMPFDRVKALGYLKSFKAVLGGVPPILPARSNGSKS